MQSNTIRINIVILLMTLFLLSFILAGCFETSYRPFEKGATREREAERIAKTAKDNIALIRKHFGINEEELSDRDLGKRLYGTIIYFDEEKNKQVTLEELTNLVVAKIERGYEVEKFVYGNKPAETIKLAEPTDKAVNILSILDFTGSVFDIPVVGDLPPGFSTTIGWGARTAARALELTGMLTEVAYRDSLRAYIDDRNRNKFDSSEEAINIATIAVLSPTGLSDQLDKQYQMGMGFDSLNLVATQRSAGLRNLIQGIGTYSVGGCKDLMRVFEFDYQSFKLATDEKYREEIKNVILGSN